MATNQEEPNLKSPMIEEDEGTAMLVSDRPWAVAVASGQSVI
jgi:hypothetical protein